jgi:hypothetical protein
MQATLPVMAALQRIERSPGGRGHRTAIFKMD